MNLTMIGTGYVGLVTGTCLAEMGHRVTCVDLDPVKIEQLRRGVIPIHEPDLEPLVQRNQAAGRLRFTTVLPEALAEADIHFIAVGTPPGEDGSADLTHVLAAARQIGQHISRYSVIIDKSTVPVGTAEQVRSVLQQEITRRGLDVHFDVASNPEFLREGAAVDDFMNSDRIIIGCDQGRVRELLSDLYAPGNRERILFMGIRDAEMTKYAANAMLATRISFMNEMADLCERLGADVEQVRRGIGSDKRIGPAFLHPGCGYGGSCFPKDVKALIHMAEGVGSKPVLLRAVELRNEAQKRLLFEKIARRFGSDLSGRCFAVWGLAFKPGTDDMREASSVVLLQALLEAGAEIRAHDPEALTAARRVLPPAWLDGGRLQLTDDPYAALAGAHALVLVTEWDAYRHPDFRRMAALMATPAIFDGRNVYDPDELRRLGFEYQGIGRVLTDGGCAA